MRNIVCTCNVVWKNDLILYLVFKKPSKSSFGDSSSNISQLSLENHVEYLYKKRVKNLMHSCGLSGHLLSQKKAFIEYV